MNTTPPTTHNVDHRSADVGGAAGDAPSWLATTQFELVVDNKTKFFPLSWIPIQTATAIHETDSQSDPEPLGGKYEALVAALAKLTPSSDGEPFTEPLTGADWGELNQLWRKLPPLFLPATKSQFAPYEAAILRSKGQLTFDLEVLTSVEGWAPDSKIFEATLRHRELLKEQVLKGLIVPRDQFTMEACPGQFGANLVLTLEELCKFANQFLISVRVDAAGAGDDKSKATPKTAANPLGAPWRREGLGVLERRDLLLAQFRKLGGSVDKDGKLHSNTGALAALVRLDGRQKDTLREQLVKAAMAEAATPEVDADASTSSTWFPHSSSPATRKR